MARPPAPTPASLDLEALVGRYGTLALATLTILLGVGAFLGWAITHHLLGPWLRIALGAALAAAIAALGQYVRGTRSTRFGNALLGLALAVFHVDAWGAGPRLHLVPDVVALLIAAVASGALAAFAYSSEEELLFAVGVGGALLAPFVTMSGQPHVISLLVYGYVVITIAMFALRRAEWVIAARLLALGCAMYTLLGLAAALATDSASITLAPVAFALAIAATALLAVPRRDRAFVVVAALTIMTVALLFRVTNRQLAEPTAAVVLAAIATAVAYASVWTTPDSRFDIPEGVGAAVLPLAFLVAAMFTTKSHALQGVFAAGWAVAALLMASLDADRREIHWATGALAVGVGIVAAMVQAHATASVVALAVVAAVCTSALRTARARPMVVPALLALITGAAMAFDLLSQRQPYRYTPFLTEASLAAFAISVAWIWFAWQASRLLAPRMSPGTNAALRLSGLAVAFTWVRAELVGAGSPDIAAFLLIAYYAACGVGAVFLGRARALPVLRHVGLALAIYAALKTVIEGSSMAIGLRIGSYFVAGLFMMSVAYWYRDGAARLTPTGAVPSPKRP